MPYRLNYREINIVRDRVMELMDNEFTEEYNSRYGSYIIVVTKTAGGNRLGVDSRTIHKPKTNVCNVMARRLITHAHCTKYCTSLDISSNIIYSPIVTIADTSPL